MAEIKQPVSRQDDCTMKMDAKVDAEVDTDVDALQSTDLKAKEEVDSEVEVVEFRLAQERYAIESRYVREVSPLKEVCPLPCTPAFVLGLINVRGQLLSLIDLRAFFALAPAALEQQRQMLILHQLLDQGAMEIAIVVDGSLTVRHLPR